MNTGDCQLCHPLSAYSSYLTDVQHSISPAGDSLRDSRPIMCNRYVYCAVQDRDYLCCSMHSSYEGHLLRLNSTILNSNSPLVLSPFTAVHVGTCFMLCIAPLVLYLVTLLISYYISIPALLILPSFPPLMSCTQLIVTTKA